MRILFEPNSSEGGGAPVAQPNATEFTPAGQTMPDSLKGQTIDFAEIESEVPPTRHEDFNKPTTPDPKVVKEPTVTKVAEQVKAPEQTKQQLKEGELPELPKLKTAAEVKQAQATPQQQQEQPPKKGARDYSKFDTEDVPFLKQATNEAFAYWEKKLPELKLAKQQLVEVQTKLAAIEKDPNAIPREWYNHAESYQLHPTWRAGMEQYQRAQFEQQHYSEQLRRIKSSEGYVNLLGYNKQGQPVFSEEQKPSPQAEVDMMNRMNAAGGVVNNLSGQLQAFQQNFNGHYTQLNTAIDNVINTKCPWILKDPKDPRQEYAKQFDKAVPGEFLTHPSHKAARALWAELYQAVKTNEELAAQLATGKKLSEIKEQVEPKVETSVQPAIEQSTRSTIGKKLGPLKTFDLIGVGD